MDSEKSICLCQNDGQMDGVCMYTHHLSIVAMRPIWLFLKNGVVYG